jgi:redox-sensitive bicupin YhaK (pirin superfamily)
LKRWLSLLLLCLALFIDFSPLLKFLKFDSSPSYNMSRQVVKTILSREQSEGMGARVRRSIGGSQLRNFDPFLLLDEFFVKKPAGFPAHPHRGFETVTYMLSGQFNHEDFVGHKGTIGPGDLQWMTAGRGIVHSEHPASTEVVHGLQLWVNLPRSEKMCEPRYQELLDKDIPKVKPEPGIEVKVIAGESFGVKSPVYTKSPTYYLDFKLGPRKQVKQAIPAHFNAFSYILEGTMAYGESGKQVDAHHTVVLSRDDSADYVLLESGDQGAHFVVIAGQPTNEAIVQYGPFVMTTQEEIQATFEDFHMGRNGFEKAPGWRASIDGDDD